MDHPFKKPAAWSLRKSRVFKLCAIVLKGYQDQTLRLYSVQIQCSEITADIT
jgi:hypothetical protein